MQGAEIEGSRAGAYYSYVRMRGADGTGERREINPAAPPLDLYPPDRPERRQVRDCPQEASLVREQILELIADT